MFKEPIGFEMSDKLGLDDEDRIKLRVNQRNFKLSKIITEMSDLRGDLSIFLRIVEKRITRKVDKSSFSDKINRIFNFTY